MKCARMPVCERPVRRVCIIACLVVAAGRLAKGEDPALAEVPVEMPTAIKAGNEDARDADFPPDFRPDRPGIPNVVDPAVIDTRRMDVSLPFLYFEPRHCCFEVSQPLAVTLYAVNRSRANMKVDWSAVIAAMALEPMGPGM